MAAEIWNRVNIPFPSAASSVRIKLTPTQVGKMKVLLMENNKVLKLFRGKILQTEIRVLHELLYKQHNSMKGFSTLKSLKQVEQCINRLKNMKLDAALQDLVDLCPTSIQMSVCIKTGMCDVPSQPMLEWICLKVLGASKLLSCTLTRCSKAFVLSKRHLKWEEFILLNVVFNSMVSRLWVIFRSILVGLTNLYPSLLEFLKDVAQAQPMPYLADTTLPADLAEFLGPSVVSLLKTHCAFGSHAKIQKMKPVEKKAAGEDLNRKRTRKVKEDLGVLIERGPGFHADVKTLFSKDKSVSEDLEKKQMLRKQVEDATTFSQMSARMEELILLCRSQRMKKTTRLLTFLHLKCKRMKHLEATGYNMQKKLKFFQQEVCKASSPQGKSGAKTSHFSAAARSTAGLRSRLQSLKRRFVLFKVRAHAKKARLVRRRKEAELPKFFQESLLNKAAHNATLQITRPDGHDDIDDIFASVGL